MINTPTFRDNLISTLRTRFGDKVKSFVVGGDAETAIITLQLRGQDGNPDTVVEHKYPADIDEMSLENSLVNSLYTDMGIPHVDNEGNLPSVEPDAEANTSPVEPIA